MYIRLNRVISSMKFDSKARQIFKKLPNEVKNYFYEVDEKCKKHKINFRLSGGKSLNADGARCGGWFDDSNKELAIALDMPLKWSLSILLHEESHLDQWLDPTSVWYNYGIYNSFPRFFSWLTKESELRDPLKEARKIIILEADCEKRTLRKIKKRWSHIIDFEVYSRSANAYMFSYLWMAKTRKWIGSCVKQHHFLKNFPIKMQKQYEFLPEKYLKLFLIQENKKPLPKREGA